MKYNGYMKPKIAVLLRINDGKFTVNPDYVSALIQAGAIPVMVAPQAYEDLKVLFTSIDGLLIPGGNDIDPKQYGQSNTASRGILPEIDKLDLDAIQIAQASDLPIFGICRGLQVLNVALGGSLIQDIPTSVKTQLNHNFSWKHEAPLNGHLVQIDPASDLFTLLGSQIEVNSYHHQAIQELAPGLRITAKADDGVIEAIEGDRLFAVQWHPERMTSLVPFQSLFDYFVNQCRK